MKKIVAIILLTVAGCLVTPQQAYAIDIFEVIKQAVITVIRAVDLMIQRMQNEIIALQNAAKVLENKLSQLRLTEIAQWSERQREQYKNYFDELWRIKNTIATYQRVKQIIARQKQLVTEYKTTWQMINRDRNFTREELEYMYVVYTGILNKSFYHVEQLLLVINAFQMQMSDASRLEIINKTGDQIEANYYDLKEFNNQNIRMSLQRAHDDQEINAVKQLYGLND